MVVTSPGKGSQLATLEELPIAEVFEPDQLARIASLVEALDCDADAALFEPGDDADALFVVLSGRVSLTMQVPGREPTIVASLSRGDIFGWEALRSEAVRTTTARASKATRCLRCDGDALRRQCELDHELGYRIMSHAFDIVVGELSNTRVQLLDIYGYGQQP